MKVTANFKVFDSHLHIIDPQFPLVANDGFLPEPFTVDAYLTTMSGFSLCGGAIVSGSFQAFDQAYLLAALRALGPGFVGVTQLPSNTPDNQIIELNRAGVRAIRFNLHRGGSEGIGSLVSMARRVYELAGWHVELYADASTLDSMFDTLTRLPAVSIDHLGLKRTGLPTLLRLAEKGVRVKASGFGRIDFEVADAVRALHKANPASLMFGSDLPSTRAKTPFKDTDIQIILEAVGEEAAERVLTSNAIEFYKPKFIDQVTGIDTSRPGC